MKRILIGVIASLTSTCLFPSTATAQQALVVKALAEKKVTELPAGPLFWRLENFPTLAQAQVAAGTTGLVAESAGKGWLFTLGGAGGASVGGPKGAAGGTLPQGVGTHDRLRLKEARGPP